MTLKTTLSVSLMAAAVVVMVGCKGNPAGPPPPPPPPPPMTQGEADTLARSLHNSVLTAMAACVQRVTFNPNGFGTFPLNFSCDAQRNCNGGGTIRPSITATGQVVVSRFGASINMPLSGSQNILDWGCAGNYIVSGNPTVSLNGLIAVTNAGAFTGRIDHSGQIIYGQRGGSQRTCSVSLRSTDNTVNVQTTGTICGLTVNIV